MEVVIHGRWKEFLLDIAFQTNGDMLGILGASGCGKSMTLKTIAGVETPQTGRIAVNGTVLFDSLQKINLKPQKRKVGYLFQNYALFPNMSVDNNIACAIQTKKEDKRNKVRELVQRFRLDGLGKRYPGQLSGGQQQRVALARILAYEPDVLLLDEPFSALDYHLREQLQLELLDLLKNYRGDIILVTHSRDEVYRFCKQLLVLDQGRIIAFGDTKEIFRKPMVVSVARLTGCKNISRAQKTGNNIVYAIDWDLSFTVRTPIPETMDHIGIRAHDFKVCTQENSQNRLPIIIKETMESPFEWNAIIKNADNNDTQDIWWVFGKEYSHHEYVTSLTVAPENVLLLSSTQP